MLLLDFRLNKDRVALRDSLNKAFRDLNAKAKVSKDLR